MTPNHAPLSPHQVANAAGKRVDGGCCWDGGEGRGDGGQAHGREVGEARRPETREGGSGETWGEGKKEGVEGGGEGGEWEGREEWERRCMCM